MEESGVLGTTHPSSQTNSTLRHLLDETADLIESPNFTRVLMLLNNECFETLVKQCTTDAFRSGTPAPTTDPQSFTSVATVVPGVESSEPTTKLANVLAVMARQAHVIGNGTNPPNLYLNVMDQDVRELEAFAAVVYSSNFDHELLASGSKKASMAAEPEDGTAYDMTSSQAPVMVDKEDNGADEGSEYQHIVPQEMSTTAGGDESTFETAWGKAFDDHPSGEQ